MCTAEEGTYRPTIDSHLHILACNLFTVASCVERTPGLTNVKLRMSVGCSGHLDPHGLSITRAPVCCEDRGLDPFVNVPICVAVMSFFSAES
jgi:hypothetical protein